MRTQNDGAGGAVTSLDKATKLGRPDPPAGWVLGLYPDAAEAGGTFHATRMRQRHCRDETLIEPDLDRAQSEAARRARTAVRRYMAANGIRRMGTLTYAGRGLHDQRALRRHVGHYFKRLRSEVVRRPYAYVWVPEWHPGGHGLHVHFGIDRHIKQARLQEVWGRGIVDIRLFKTTPETGTRGASRRAAGYLSKYVAKAMESHERSPGLHRYEVAQGFKPRVERIIGRTREDAIELASLRMKALPERVWTSDEADDWRGPPAIWAAWR